MAGGAWYRQPLLWFGIVITAAILAGCIWMIVVAAQHPDVPVDQKPERSLLGMPLAHPAPARSSTP